MGIEKKRKLWMFHILSIYAVDVFDLVRVVPMVEWVMENNFLCFFEDVTKETE